MKKFLFALALFMGSALGLRADDPTQLKNMLASIEATDYKTARFIDKTTVNGKEYIMGKPSSYNKNGEANGGSLVWPHVVYDIKSKMLGGTYHVTVHYRVDKDKVASNPTIQIGMDMIQPETVSLREQNMLINTARATFKVKLLSGKSHNIKLWLPSEGIMISKVDVRKAIFSKKEDKE